MSAFDQSVFYPADFRAPNWTKAGPGLTTTWQAMTPSAGSTAGPLTESANSLNPASLKLCLKVLTHLAVAYRCHPKYTLLKSKRATPVKLSCYIWPYGRHNFASKYHRDPAKNSCISFALCSEWMQPKEEELFMFMHLLLWRHTRFKQSVFAQHFFY